jgi:hypothetical protein
MNASWGITGFIGVVVGLIAFVVKAEYPDWGRRLARLLVGFAASELGSRGEVRREEWLAELDAIWRDTDKACTGLTFAGSLATRFGMWTLLKESFLMFAELPFFLFALAHVKDGVVAENALRTLVACVVSLPVTYVVQVRLMLPAMARMARRDHQRSSAHRDMVPPMQRSSWLTYLALGLPPAVLASSSWSRRL